MSLLDGHPNLLVDVGESRFFARFLAAARRTEPSQRDDVAISELLYLFKKGNVYKEKFLPDVDSDRVITNFKIALRNSSRSPREYLEAYFRSIGEVTGQLNESTKYWVEKTPYHEYRLRHILRWWPQAAFLHLLRDPRDAYASYVVRSERKNARPESLPAFCSAWRRSCRVAQRCLTSIGRGRYLLLRYEDLASRPREVMTLVAEALGIDWSDNLLRPTKNSGATAWKGNAADQSDYRGVSAQALGRFRSVLGAEEVQRIERLLGREMKELDYRASVPSPLIAGFRTPLDRLALVLRDFKHGLTSAVNERYW